MYHQKPRSAGLDVDKARLSSALTGQKFGAMPRKYCFQPMSESSRASIGIITMRAPPLTKANPSILFLATPAKTAPMKGTMIEETKEKTTIWKYVMLSKRPIVTPPYSTVKASAKKSLSPPVITRLPRKAKTNA